MHGTTHLQGSSWLEVLAALASLGVFINPDSVQVLVLAWSRTSLVQVVEQPREMTSPTESMVEQPRGEMTSSVERMEEVEAREEVEPASLDLQLLSSEEEGSHFNQLYQQVYYMAFEASRHEKVHGANEEEQQQDEEASKELETSQEHEKGAETTKKMGLIDTPLTSMKEQLDIKAVNSCRPFKKRKVDLVPELESRDPCELL